jgi:hypothetical protein
MAARERMAELCQAQSYGEPAIRWAKNSPRRARSGTGFAKETLVNPRIRIRSDPESSEQNLDCEMLENNQLPDKPT